MIQLRDYQTAAIDRVREAMKTHRRILLVLPTGAGKTATASYMVGTAAEKGLTSIFSVHRTELLRQTSREFENQSIIHDTIQSGKGFNPHHKTFVGAIQTMNNRVSRIPRPDLLIIDEAHHACSPSWSKFIIGVKPRFIVGLTATPWRLDGSGLGEQFDVIVQGPTIAELISRGFLSPYKIYAPTSIDLTGVRTTAGDYNRGEIADLMDKPKIIGDAVEHYAKLTPFKRAVVFCTSVGHAEHVAAAFRDAGFSAASIDGTMSAFDRYATLSKFERGDIHVLTSCDLVSEGFDLPAIEVAISLRPTQSLSLWLQQVGRALRLFQGKTHATILDHVGNTARHGFPDDEREWSLEGRPKRSRGARDADAEINVRCCDKCYGVHKPAPICPYCGHVYPIQERKIEQVDGELVELDAARLRATERREQGRAQTLDELLELAKQRGYKAGWAHYIFKSRQEKKGAA